MIVTAGELRVYTFREGALAAVGHDLALRATRWRVELRPEARTVTATVEAASLEVLCARSHGADDHGALSAGDRAKVAATARDEILRAGRYPELRFEGRWEGDDPRAVDGALTLRGVTRPLTVRVRREGPRVVIDATLAPSAWGIAPYRAMLGALRVQDDVRIAWSIEGLPAAAVAP